MCAKRPVTTTTPNQPTASRAQAASESFTEGNHLLGLWGRRQANQQSWYRRLGRGAEAAGVHDVGDEEERSTSHIMRSMDAYTTDRARRQTHSRQAPGGAAKGRCTQTQHLQESTHGKRHAVQRCILCRFASQRTGQVDSPQTRKARGNPNPSPACSCCTSAPTLPTCQICTSSLYSGLLGGLRNGLVICLPRAGGLDLPCPVGTLRRGGGGR